MFEEAVFKNSLQAPYSSLKFSVLENFKFSSCGCFSHYDPTGFTREDVMRAISVASREYSRVSGINPTFTDLGGDTVRRTVFGLLGPTMQIDSMYLDVLTESQKIDLLNTVLHESKHYQDGFLGTLVGELSGGWNKRIGDWQYHIDIYNRSDKLTEKYKNEYLCGK